MHHHLDHIKVLRPSSGWRGIDLRELWDYRELLYFLVWRDIKVRYKQTALGAAWAVIQPFLTMVVFTIFFGRLAGIPSDGIPYPVFSFAALVPWTFFANAVAQSANSLVGSQNLLQKVYFPRLAIPVSATLACAVDFLVAFAVLLLMMLAYGITPTIHVVWLPLFLALAWISALGIGLWLAALNVLYRDVRYVVAFLIQIWMFATPVVYPSSMLDEPWRTLYAINPMAGVIEGFRWALLGGSALADSEPLATPLAMIAVSTMVAILVLVGGALYFRRLERSFADVV
jgi:lipopolysaccharide transport system permease protein